MLADPHRHEQPAKADILANHHTELKDLRGTENYQQSVHEWLVDALMIVSKALCKFDGKLLALV